MTKPMTEDDRAVRGLKLIAVLVLLLLVGFLLIVLYLRHRAEVAAKLHATRNNQISHLQGQVAQGQDVAAQVAEACLTASGRRMLAAEGVNCAKASAVASQPTITVTNGPAGPAGANGINGLIGATGLTGPRGPEGPKGARGETGVAGLPGAQGVPGDPGSVGASGAPGANGADGSNGTNGQDGAKGDTGDQGPKGDTGSTGPAGPAGPPCTDGTHLGPVQYVDPTDPLHLTLIDGIGCINDPTSTPTPSGAPSS